jgi:serine/threonine protein kinase
VGEVYRATDTNLDHQVAIKILPDPFVHDPDRLARFEREAKTLATVNHSNIAQIYGLEKAHGIRALVMELVEGPTLADRLAEGPTPLDERCRLHGRSRKRWKLRMNATSFIVISNRQYQGTRRWHSQGAGFRFGRRRWNRSLGWAQLQQPHPRSRVQQ